MNSIVGGRSADRNEKDVIIAALLPLRWLPAELLMPFLRHWPTRQAVGGRTTGVVS